MENRKIIALPIITLVTGALMWGVIWFPIRFLSDNGLSGIWSALLMYLIATLVGIFYIIVSRSTELKHWKMLVLMGLASGWCNISFILAVIDGNIVRVLLLFYLSPLWTILIAKFLLNEKMSNFSRLVFCVSICGAFVVLWDSNLGFPWPRESADWLAISSGFAFAVANVVVRKLASVNLWVKSTMTWIGVIFIAFFLILLTNSAVPDIALDVLAVAVLMGFIVVIMSVLVVYGVTHMPVYRSAIILLIEIVAGVISAQILTNEKIFLHEWVGGFLIVSASCVVAVQHFSTPKVNATDS